MSYAYILSNNGWFWKVIRARFYIRTKINGWPYVRLINKYPNR